MNPPLKLTLKGSSEELLPCPGKRLRVAREAKKIDISRVAEQLHLSRALVEAMEAEDFENLPARVFVRGYYRNYARLVDVPEAVILADFDERCPDGECQGAPPPVKTLKSEIHSGHGIIRVVTWLIVASLLFMLVFWGIGYLSKQQIAEPIAIQPSFEAELKNNKASDVSYPEVVTEKTAPSTRVEQTTQPSNEEVAVVAADRDKKKSLELQEAVSDLPVEVAKTQPVLVPIAGEIEISFNADCWVNIRDSSGQFKLLGTMRAGDRRKFGGRPPFTVVFGNYKAVTMTIGGKPYDLSVHRVGQTAKFTLNLN